MPSGRLLREGAPAKRQAILTAARELFLADGYDGTSVDAVAARASASKRTVYDYFGDKRRLLLAVVEDLGDQIMDGIRSIVETTLAESEDVREALLRFALSVKDSALGSFEYHSLLRLIETEGRNLPELRDHWLDEAPEEVLAQRLAALAEEGRLRIADPSLAADHLIALTLGPARAHSFDARSDRDDPQARQERAAAGVDVFLAAYGPTAQPGRSSGGGWNPPGSRRG